MESGERNVTTLFPSVHAASTMENKKNNTLPIFCTNLIYITTKGYRKYLAHALVVLEPALCTLLNYTCYSILQNKSLNIKSVERRSISRFKCLDIETRWKRKPRLERRLTSLSG